MNSKRKRISAIVLAGALSAGIAAMSGCAKAEEAAEAPPAAENPIVSVVQEPVAEPMPWWKTAVAYEIYPMSFNDTDDDGIGDLKGITEKLNYLEEIGVEAAWLTPVYASPMVDNGYDISDYYSINPLFGTMADMDELIAKAAEHNIRIVMDLVFNHTSDQHAWFLESRSGRNNEKSDWYIWEDPAPDGGAPNNWRSIFGGSAWTYCEERGQYYLHTFAEQQPDLNWENQELRKALYDVANFWIDKGVGGFRIDAVTYIKKPADLSDGPVDANDGMSSIHAMTANTEGILDFLREFKENVTDGSDVFTVAEANGVSPGELKYWVGDEGVFDMLFEFDLIKLGCENEVWCRPQNWKLTDMKGFLNASEAATAENGWYPVFFENHDQPRSIDHFLPDAADKTAAGKALGTVLMTVRGTPFVYQGEELGCTNVAWADIEMYNDISSHNQYKTALNEGLSPEEALAAVHRFSRDNARTPMQWDSSENAGFTGGTPWLPVNENYTEINAASEEKNPGSVLLWYRELASLRAELPALTEGDFEMLLPDDENIFAFRRTAQEQEAVILVNFTDKEQIYDAGLTDGMNLAADSCGDAVYGTLKPYQALIFKTE